MTGTKSYSEYPSVGGRAGRAGEWYRQSLRWLMVDLPWDLGKAGAETTSGDFTIVKKKNTNNTGGDGMAMRKERGVPTGQRSGMNPRDRTC